MREAGGRLLRDEGGFTLSEMMVVTMMLTVVLFALYGIFDASIRVFSFGNNTVEATEQARAGLGRMEREIRAAYPVDKVATTPRDHVLFVGNGASKITPALPPTETRTNPGTGQTERFSRSLTFGNDLPQGSPSAPNFRVDDNEVITYQLSGPGSGGACPTTGTQNDCTLQRVAYTVNPSTGAVTSSASPAVEFVVRGGLTFALFGSDGAPVPVSSNGTDVQVVRISLTVRVGGDNATHTLATDVDLRGQEAG